MALRYDFRVIVKDVRLSTGKQNKILESRTRVRVMAKLSKVFFYWKDVNKIRLVLTKIWMIRWVIINKTPTIKTNYL